MWLKLLLLQLLYAGVALAATECTSRDYGNTGTVCVCNAARCDTIDPLGQLQPLSYTLYTSNLAGLRFNRSEGRFSEPDPDDRNLITVDRTVTYQTIHGFGGAFTDAAGININSLNAQAKAHLMRSYFSDEGIEYNIGRVPIGGTDFSTRAYSYLDTDRPDLQLREFALQEEDFNHKIPLILEAMNLTEGELILFASAWTAPKWMKTNEEYVGGSLKPEYYQLWVQYFVKFLDLYGEEGVEFWGLTTGNEPSLSIFTFTGINTVGWLPSEQRRWVKENLGPTIRDSEYSDLKLIAHDDQTILLPLLSIFFDDVDVRNYIDGIAVHWYWNFLTPYEWLKQAHVEHPDKFIMNTEACKGDRPWDEPVVLGSWQRGEEYALDIIQDLQNWVTAWVDWNLVLDLGGGPTYINNTVDAAIIVNSTAGEFYKQPIYYALGHFAKFLPRNSIRIGLAEQHEGLYLVTFDRPDNITALIIINKYDTARSIILSDGHLGVIRTEITAKSFNTLLYNNERVSQDSAAANPQTSMLALTTALILILYSRYS